MARSTVDNRFHALDIGLPHSVGTSVGMGNFNTESNALAADIALSHWMHLLSIGEITNKNLKETERYNTRL